MNAAPARSAAIAPLVPVADVYEPYREKMDEYRRVAARDGLKAEPIYAEAQVIWKAFTAGVEFARARG